MEIKLKRYLVIEFRLIKGIGDSFDAITIVVRLCKQTQRLSCRVHSKESVITTAGCVRGQRERVLYYRITGLDTIKREIK